MALFPVSLRHGRDHDRLQAHDLVGVHAEHHVGVHVQDLVGVEVGVHAEEHVVVQVRVHAQDHVVVRLGVHAQVLCLYQANYLLQFKRFANITALVQALKVKE